MFNKFKFTYLLSYNLSSKAFSVALYSSNGTEENSRAHVYSAVQCVEILDVTDTVTLTIMLLT